MTISLTVSNHTSQFFSGHDFFLKTHKHIKYYINFLSETSYGKVMKNFFVYALKNYWTPMVCIHPLTWIRCDPNFIMHTNNLSVFS